MDNLRFLLRAGAVLVLGTVVTSTLLAGPSPGPQERGVDESAPRFPAGVDVVTVDVVVLDRDGNPIPGLGAEDFTIKDEGRIRSIASFEAVVLPESEPQPKALRSRVSTNTQAPSRPERTFVIVFDNVHMDQTRAKVAKRAVEEFMTTGLSDGDRVTLIPTSGGAWWTAQLPQGRDDIVAALARLEGERPRILSPERISDYEAMMLYLHRDNKIGSEVVRRFYQNRVILEPPGYSELASPEVLDLGGGHPLIRIKAAEVYQAALARQQATFKALERAAEALSQAKGRKAILLVSEGFIQETNRPEFKDVVRAARQANAVVYFLDARGLTGLPPTADAEYADPTEERDIAGQLAEGVRESLGAVSVAVETGGFAIKNSNDIAKGMRRIDRESRSYYLLGFPIADVKRDGKFHDLDVEVDRPGAKVIARKGYYAPSDEPEKKRDPETLDPVLRTAIDSPFDADAIPLRLGSYVLGPSGKGVSVLFTAEVDPRGLRFESKDGRFEDTLGTFLLISARDTGETFHREKEVALSLPPPVHARMQETWVPLARDLELAPGTYQARFLVRELGTRRVGTVRHEFEVPPLDELRVSTPILTDVLTAAGAPGTPPRPVPLARRTFAPGRTLYYVFEVFGAKAGSDGSAPRVSAGYRVESVDGKVIGAQPDSPLPPGPNGELQQMYALNLTGLPAGDYLIVLEIRDEGAGKTLEVFDPFSVAAAPSATASTGLRP